MEKRSYRYALLYIEIRWLMRRNPEGRRMLKSDEMNIILKAHRKAVEAAIEGGFPPP